jgi:toxin FitB
MFILDTNVVSELRKVRVGKAHPRLAEWAESVQTMNLYVSAITIEELEIGVLLVERRDPQQGAMFRAWMNTHVLPAFADRILPVDVAFAQCSARLHVPDPRPLRDALIAATGLVHGMAVVTRNVTDFQSTGVAIVNPWETEI